MPIMDGYEACQKIRDMFLDDNTVLMPKLIALSSQVSDEIEARCLETGFDKVILAPLQAQMISQ